MWRQDTSAAAEPRARLSRRGLRWALEGIVVQHLSVARVAEGLAVAWNTANGAVLAEGRRALIADPRRFDGWRQTAEKHRVASPEFLSLKELAIRWRDDATSRPERASDPTPSGPEATPYS